MHMLHPFFLIDSYHRNALIPLDSALFALRYDTLSKYKNANTNTNTYTNTNTATFFHALAHTHKSNRNASTTSFH